LHYGLEAFEGMKAFKDSKGNVRLFRPWDNMQRFIESSTRLALPTFDKSELLKCICKLIQIDSDWVPTKVGYSLYIRPTIISTSEALGVSPSSDALLFVILSPVGPYYASGFKPVSLYVTEDYVRAWPGGTGKYKVGINYGPTIKGTKEAQERGHSQCLWLTNGYVTEVGSMNFFVFWINEDGEKELITPPLDDGLILPGVIRQSVIDITRKWNEFKVSEKRFDINQFVAAIRNGKVIESFGTGTAAVIAPVKGIEYNNKKYDIPITQGNSGELAKRLLDTITGIQYGQINHEWSYKI